MPAATKHVKAIEKRGPAFGDEPKVVTCPATAFGPHGGEQYRSPRYFACGCDAGYCERHAVARPFGPSYVKGDPRKCRKHRAAALSAASGEQGSDGGVR